MRTLTARMLLISLFSVMVALIAMTAPAAQASPMYWDFDLVAVEAGQASVSGVDLSSLTVRGGSLDFSTAFQKGNANWHVMMRAYGGDSSLLGSLYVEIRITNGTGPEIYKIEETRFTSTSIPDADGTLDLIFGAFTSRTNATSSGEEVTREGYSGQRITYKVLRSTVPLIPPGAVARVLNDGGRSQVLWPKSPGWRPLMYGDALTPGCIILTGGEGDPQLGGGRVKIALSETFTCVIEPYSRVEILEGGVRVESGSIEAGDKPPVENYNAYNDNGFCSGKDPGAVQPPFSAQGVFPATPLAPAASGDVRYRFETLSDGTARVSVLEGAAEVRSAATQAKALLRAGQQITMTAQGLGSVLEKSFTDVPTDHDYRTAIIGMALKEIVNGYKKGDLWEFRPTDPVKRAQFAKMIVGAMAIAPKTSTQTRFSDLGTPDAAGYPHIFVQAAYDNHITTGTNAAQTTFAPWDPIKRAQVVTMIVRAANQLWPGVLKTPPAGWAGQMASFTDVNHGTNMRTAEYNGLLEGLQGFSRTWDPWKQATRGEVAQMLWNLMTR